jgi:hypothetical protein
MAATSEAPDPNGADTGNGALAQLGERLHGMQEVSGSIPLGSTSFAGVEPSRGWLPVKRLIASEGCGEVAGNLDRHFQMLRDGPDIGRRS